jgi:hypothetical protein
VAALLPFVCAIPASAKAPERPVLKLSVKLSSGEACRMELLGVAYRLPDDTSRLQTALSAIGKTVHHILLATEKGAPWRCVGGAMALAARADIVPGFVSEPPPATEH